MALFMDSHAIDGGVKATDVAQAHLADLQTQDRYGVRYLRYWVDEAAGKIFCLVDAPDADAAIRVHREAHGLVAESIHPVVEGLFLLAILRVGGRSGALCRECEARSFDRDPDIYGIRAVESCRARQYRCSISARSTRGRG
jgi:hypothetical protein